jgi:hypothetical protein
MDARQHQPSNRTGRVGRCPHTSRHFSLSACVRQQLFLRPPVAVGWWLSQFAILFLALGASTGLSANPLRADDSAQQSADTKTVAVAPDSAADDLQLPPGHPTKVEVDIEMVEVSQIQDHDQKFDVEFNAYFVWNDPRLAFDEQATGMARKVIAADSLWTPDPLLVDELDVDSKGGTTVHVHPDGTVHMNRYYRGTVAGNFDLHEFPLDRHKLDVDLEATDYESDEVVFTVGEVKAANPAHTVPHGWKLNEISAETAETTYARIHETYSLLRVTVDVSRDPHFYFWSIVLPLIPIVATAWSVFWMDPKEFSSQVGVGITAMLTVVAYRITIDSSLPPLTYMTRMDYFLLVCQTFVFIAFVATVAIHVLYALDDPHMRARAARVGELCRWLPPVVLAVISVFLAVLPVRYGTYVILAPIVLLAIWLRVPITRLPIWIRALVRPETLLASSPVLSDRPAPHARFDAEAPDAKAGVSERRSA